MVVMVVGGNGQLGAACCEILPQRGEEVRATVRDRKRAGHLEGPRVEVVLLDVTDSAQRRQALEGVDVVILTANSVAARGGDDPAAFDRGMLALVDEAASGGVSRFVLPSVPASDWDQQVAPMRAKRDLEDQLLGLAGGWVLRLPPFMEVWFALVGSSLPLRGEPHATIARPSPFLRRFRSVTGSLVDWKSGDRRSCRGERWPICTPGWWVGACGSCPHPRRCTPPRRGCWHGWLRCRHARWR